MNERVPLSSQNQKEVIPDSRSMTELETFSFLKEKGIRPLEGWHLGMPVLYILEEVIRGDEGPFGDIPSEFRPSIARVDSPTALDFSKPMKDDDDDRVVYPLLNETGGQVDFYAIDHKTKEISFMLIPRLPEYSIRTARSPFHVRREALFHTDDSLFPKALSRGHADGGR